jgi:predicted double-glycine peptidase
MGHLPRIGFVRAYYEKSITVTDEEMAECRIKRNKFQGDWTYEILPGKAA